ncbi:MAG: hypothetical protein JAY62_12515 [Candidatus Thiodiazotropha endolucinida]|nr:hypothetical protein [Candidatus Thiodiazotropha taylori]MCW4275945.1 hypothetical protein [Candidatus Thiodiazotropha taylori]
MAFLRTESGLSNLRLFYDSEIVIFTEGGERSLSIADVEGGACNQSSIDAVFWRNVLRASGYDAQIEFRPVGSKSTLNIICQKILDGEIENVAIAADRDMDGVVGGVYQSPRIMYTKGYSWENDVFTKELTQKQIESMLLLVNVPAQVQETIEDAYANFEVIGRHLARIEVLFRQQGVRFISECGGERFFNGKKSPYIDKGQIAKLINEKKTLVQRPLVSPNPQLDLCPLMSNYGKLIKALSIAVITYVCRTFGDIKSIPIDMLTSSMLERFIRKIEASADEYYTGITHDLLSDLGMQS